MAEAQREAAAQSKEAAEAAARAEAQRLSQQHMQLEIQQRVIQQHQQLAQLQEQNEVLLKRQAESFPFAQCTLPSITCIGNGDSRERCHPLLSSWS